MNPRLYWMMGIALAAFVLFGNAGFRDWIARSREKKRMEQGLIRLRADHEALSKEWTQIQQDPSYTEYLIRKNLGYVKKGEVEYDILKKDK
jgi:cell division protein FtsB